MLFLYTIESLGVIKMRFLIKEVWGEADTLLFSQAPRCLTTLSLDYLCINGEFDQNEHVQL